MNGASGPARSVLSWDLEHLVSSAPVVAGTGNRGFIRRQATPRQRRPRYVYAPDGHEKNADCEYDEVASWCKGCGIVGIRVLAKTMKACPERRATLYLSAATECEGLSMS